VYRLLLLISRSAAAGEKGKQKKNRETQGKVPQVSGASSAEDAVASAHITDRMLATWVCAPTALHLSKHTHTHTASNKSWERNLDDLGRSGGIFLSSN
jgi:hypothetical protein